MMGQLRLLEVNVFSEINKEGEMVIRELYKLIPGYFNDEGEMFIGKPKSLASKTHPYMPIFNLNRVKEYWINKEGEKVKKQLLLDMQPKILRFSQEAKIEVIDHASIL
jgi:hypothetical protein